MIELLAVIAVIGVAAALALPAVQRARATARKNQCLKNLQQLALACHAYHDTHKVFPPGNVDRHFPAAPFRDDSHLSQVLSFPAIQLGVQSQYDQTGNIIVEAPPQPVSISSWVIAPPWTWMSFILPQLEQANINVRFDLRKDDPANLQAMQATVPSFVCPSTFLPLSPPGNFGWGTYRGVMGSEPLDDPHPETNSQNVKWSTNGILFPNSAVRHKDITDGASNTLMIGDSRFGFWSDGTSCCARFRDDRQIPTDFNNFWPVPPDHGGLQFFSFGSQHENVAMFAMADGSTRPINESIDKTLLRGLATRAGGETINPDD